MSFPPANLNTPLNTRKTVTDAQWESTVGNLIRNSTPFLYWLNSKKHFYRGGNSIALPVKYAAADPAESYLGQQPGTFTETETLTAAQFPAAHYRSKFFISRTDLQRNRGPAARLDLKKEKYDDTAYEMRKKLTTDIFGSATTEPNIVGLRNLVSATATTCGGIDASVETEWDNGRDTTAYGALGVTMPLLQQFMGSVSDGIDAPDCVVTTQAVYNQVWAVADSRQRLGVEEFNKMGFRGKTIDFNGIPIMVDKACPDGYLWMLNSKYLWLYVSDNEDMVWDTELRDPRYSSTFKYLYWTGQLVCNNRRRQFVATGLTA